MKKNAIVVFLAFIMLISSFGTASAMLLEYDGETHDYTGSIYDLYVNGEKIETPLAPIIFNDRAVVPVREVFEAMGATVDYEHNSKSVTVTTDEIQVIVVINQDTAIVNGKFVTIPDGVTPKLIAKSGESAKTMVPVRFISESLGMNVSFSQEQMRISIDDPTVKPTTKPDITVEEKTLNLTSIKTNTSKSDTVVITITADKPIKSMTKPVLTASGVYYTDIADADYLTKNSYTVNHAGVKTVRFGEHDKYTRIALDLDLDQAKSYHMQLSQDQKSVVITASCDPSITPTTPPKPTTTPTTKPIVTPTPNLENIEKKIVVLDAGHGGRDPGAVTTVDGVLYREKDITLSIAKKVQTLLEAEGINVVMTRSGDVYPSLTERGELANQLNAALFVSIHINSVENSPNTSGAEIYYSKSNNYDDYGTTSKNLATNILTEVMSRTGQKNRGVKTAEHVVTRTCYMPAALYEVGFITNQTELEQMCSDSFQNDVAAGIAAGIIKTWNDITIPEIPQRKQEELEKQAQEEAERKAQEEAEKQAQEETENEE